jgi:hypothetical protein
VEAWRHGERPKPAARVMWSHGCSAVHSPATAPGAAATTAAHERHALPALAGVAARVHSPVKPCRA